jgi:hypothetical protein
MTTVSQLHAHRSALATDVHQWARVRHNGAVLQQNGVLSVVKVGTGAYRVTFRDDVGIGAWHATPVQTERRSGFDEPVCLMIALQPTAKPNEIMVLTFDLVLDKLTRMDGGFHLSIHS